MVSRCAAHWAAGYPPDVRDAVARQLLDAWCWLRARAYLGVVNADSSSTTSANRRAAGDHAKGNAA